MSSTTDDIGAADSAATPEPAEPKPGPREARDSAGVIMTGIKTANGIVREFSRGGFQPRPPWGSHAA